MNHGFIPNPIPNNLLGIDHIGRTFEFSGQPYKVGAKAIRQAYP
jgi:hypothetical protein